MNIQGILSLFGALFNVIIGLFIAVAVVVFFWGLIKYIFNREGGEKEGSEGATLMFWGIIAIFVMVSIWGIIGILQRTFGVSSGGTIPAPQVNVPNVTGGGAGGLQVIWQPPAVGIQVQ